jgi:hypothetical protein
MRSHSTRSIAAPEAAVVCLVACAFAPACSGLDATAQHHLEIVGVRGRVEGCSISSGDLTLEVRSSQRRATFRASGNELLPADVAYRSIVPGGYRLSKECPRLGEPVFITLCAGCSGPAVIAIEIEPLPESGGGAPALIALRQYVDMTGENSREEALVRDSVLGVIARRADPALSLWIRGGLRELLWTYESESRAAQMIEHYGHRDLTKTIPPLRAVLERHGAATGLVQVVPYINQPSGAPVPIAAFVGYWGFFVTGVWIEEQGILTKVF